MGVRCEDSCRWVVRQREEKERVIQRTEKLVRSTVHMKRSTPTVFPSISFLFTIMIISVLRRMCSKNSTSISVCQLKRNGSMTGSEDMKEVFSKQE